jgi:hypothetical protein
VAVARAERDEPHDADDALVARQLRRVVGELPRRLAELRAGDVVVRIGVDLCQRLRQLTQLTLERRGSRRVVVAAAAGEQERKSRR